MDFFEQQERAQRQTRRLIFYFGVAVFFLALATYFVVGTIVLAYSKSAPYHGFTKLIIPPLNQLAEIILEPREYLADLWQPWLFLVVTAALGGIITVGSRFKMRQLAGGGAAVAEELGGRRLEPDTLDPAERKLLNVVAEMAIASGMPVPDVYLLDHERGINAFAAGHTRSDVAIGVTRGAARLLNRDELQGVIAHEFSHILKGDTRLNMRLIGIAHGLLWPVIVGRVMVHGSTRPLEPAESFLDERSQDRIPLLAPLGMMLIGLGTLGLVPVRLLKSAICREREWQADAAAVQFTRNPAGITGALKKVGGLFKRGRLNTARAEMASHLYFACWTYEWFGSLFSTHPPLEKRILAIDPAFDGAFPTVKMLPPTQAEREHQYESAVAHAMAFERAMPEHLLDSAGTLTAEHIRAAGTIRLGLPDSVVTALRQPHSAVALVYALLLCGKPREPATIHELLSSRVTPGMAEQAKQLAGELDQVQARHKLPLVELALPALRRLDPFEFLAFSQNVRALVEMDRAIDLFEYALQKCLFRHLQPHFAPEFAPRISYTSLTPVKRECEVLLSALAHLGDPDTAPQHEAFRNGARLLNLPFESLQFLPLADCNLPQVDAALDKLVHLKPAWKRNLLLACGRTVAADNHVATREAELLRAIADTLDCPLPPFVRAFESFGTT